ncbi:hypothetical protein D3C72_2068620 [compost metagenome]
MSRSIPSMRAGGMEMPAVPPVILRLANRKWAMKEAAIVAMARYSPLTRNDGIPTMMPPTMATRPPASRFNANGVPQRVCRMATV